MIFWMIKNNFIEREGGGGWMALYQEMEQEVELYI